MGSNNCLESAPVERVMALSANLPAPTHGGNFGHVEELSQERPNMQPKITGEIVQVAFASRRCNL
jgi:hypothetical protein